MTNIDRESKKNSKIVCRFFGRAGMRGFTLIEMMVTLAVLAVSLVALLGLRNRTAALSAHARHVTEATLLARRQVAQISLSGFPDLGIRQGDFGERVPSYLWREEVKQTPFDLVRELILTVHWSENARKEEVRFTTYLFNMKQT